MPTRRQTDEELEDVLKEFEERNNRRIKVIDTGIEKPLYRADQINRNPVYSFAANALKVNMIPYFALSSIYEATSPIKKRLDLGLAKLTGSLGSIVGAAGLLYQFSFYKDQIFNQGNPHILAIPFVTSILNGFYEKMQDHKQIQIKEEC